MTQQSTKVAQGIQSNKLGVNLLGDELFSKAWKMRNGQGSAPQAFAYGDQIYLRRGSASLLTDAVHEGTHGLDYLAEFGGTTYQWEKRAYFYERQFQLSSGSQVEHPTIKGMLEHIYKHYKKE